MENANKALIMAGATMLAVLVLSLVLITLSRIGALSAEKESEQQVEQIEKFNQEYEAYNKKLMYGVDVLSCLNKARSNNEKYINGGSNNFLTGDLYTKEYIIDVAFKLKTPLQDRIKVFYLNVQKVKLPDGSETNKVSAKETEYAIDIGPVGEGDSYNPPTDGDGRATYERVFNPIVTVKNYVSKIMGNKYENGKDFKVDNTIMSGIIPSKIGGTHAQYTKSDGFYHILEDINGITIEQGTGDASGRYVAKFGNNKEYYTNPKTDENVAAFLNMSNNLKLNVKHILNKKEEQAENAVLKYKCWDGKSVDKGWSSAEWQTSLSDFKSRKFKCEGVTYSQVTGRIINIIFTEV